MSCASHADHKNFASKAFADDIYPVSYAMTEFLNEDLENRKRRTSNAKGYDKDMIPNVAELDEAQIGRDRLVAIDTKGGTRRLSEAFYQFQTPEVSGTLDMIAFLESMAGRNYGVDDLQKGGSQPASKAVGVTFAEQSNISKRLAFQAQPFIEIGQELGNRVFTGLKDYLKEPLSIKILGEDGYNWDVIKRIDLNVKKPFEINVVSQSQENETNKSAQAAKMNALLTVRNNPPVNPGVNTRAADEAILRNGSWSEAEIALILDPNTQADKNTIAETSAAIQDLMEGRMPGKNYNATAYFMQKIYDFAITHQDDKKVSKNFDKFMDYVMEHEQIAMENEARRAKKDAMTMNAGQVPNQPGAAASAPTAPVAPNPVPMK
jgi:hypothetical protein